MRESGRIVARVHAALREAIRPGISTWELDQIAVEVMGKYDAASAFLGYRGYPASICASINNELVHGIPKKDRVLKLGDIISIDMGVRYRGFIGDSAWTYAVGEISDAGAHGDAGDGREPVPRDCQCCCGQPRGGHQPGRAAVRGEPGDACRARTIRGMASGVRCTRRRRCSTT